MYLCVSVSASMCLEWISVSLRVQVWCHAHMCACMNKYVRVCECLECVWVCLNMYLECFSEWVWVCLDVSMAECARLSVVCLSACVWVYLSESWGVFE